MSERAANNPAQPDEPPLSLSESDAGSTDVVGEPVDAASADDGSTAAVSGSASGSSAGTEAGTGGFDTMMGRIVVTSGLATPEEVELCASLMEQGASEEDEPRTLAEVLVENDFVTRRQLERLRSEFEAKRSSQRIPGYRIKKKLGAGAMATVFLARQLSLDRPVAIKVLPKKFSDNDKFIERFYKEGRAAAKLNHPNIVSAYDVGKAGDHHYFVMEYVDGETVYDLVSRKKRLDEERAIKIVKQVARALQHAHARGFVHRDIKPKNIMISKDGTVKLADLGLARAISDKEAAKAEAGRAYGTPYYISPEQIRGEMDIGPASDIYGLGATFYHMVTGRVPFEGKNPSSVMHKHLKEDLVPPDHLNEELSAGCAQVIEMMMAKSTRDRYLSAGDLLHDLDLVSAGEPPHFAHKSLDLSSIAPALASPANQAPVVMDRSAGGAQTLTTVMLVALIVSIIANLVMLGLLLTW
ncbi:MAG: serine/threonine-protein kinase [Planctomycetota bacterium]